MTVTTARFVVGHQTYPNGNITTVAPFTLPATRSSNYLWASVLGLLGGCTSCVGVAEKFGPDAVLTMLFGLVLFLGAAFLVWLARRKKDSHGVIIATAGMQVRASTTTDLHFVSRVVDALNQALATR